MLFIWLIFSFGIRTFSTALILLPAGGNGIVIAVSNAVEVEPLRRVLTAVVGR